MTLYDDSRFSSTSFEERYLFRNGEKAYTTGPICFEHKDGDTGRSFTGIFHSCFLRLIFLVWRRSLHDRSNLLLG